MSPVVKSILLLISINVALWMANTAFSFYQATIRAPDRQFAIQTPTREQIQRAIVRLVQAGRASELYAFYTQDDPGMDPVRAELYVNMALAKHLPVNLVVSVGWWEGGHMVGIADGPNPNGTMDFRPIGLNSAVYKYRTPAELAQVENNINWGTDHMVDDRERMHSWEGMLALYNHGSTAGFDERHILYVAVILRHEWELDRRFAVRFADAL